MRIVTLKNLVLPLLAVALSAFILPAQALTVKSVGSVRHGADTQVTVVFSDPVDPVSGATAANYTFTGGVAVTPGGASMMTGLPAADAAGVAENPAPAGRAVDNQCVVLLVTGLAVDANATITIQNVQDTATPPNTIASTTITFKDSGYKWAESGTPSPPGKVIAIGTNGFDIFSAGSAQWADYDEVTIVYKEITGDFDYKARIEFQDFSSHWARCGVMMRESLNEGENSATQTGNPLATPPIRGTASRYADMHANPVMDFNENGPSPLIHPANNGWESHIRRATGRQGDNGGTDSQNTDVSAPPWPNTWVRIQRTAGDVHTYHGADGVNWDEGQDRPPDQWFDTDDATELPLIPKMFVGPSLGPETGNIPATDVGGKNRLFLAQFRFTAITVPFLSKVDPNPCGVLIQIVDALPPGTQVDTSTVQLTFDGNPVVVSATKSGTITTVAYKAATPFALTNLNHAFSLTFKDNAVPPNNQKIDRAFTVPSYPTIPAAYAVASASNPGFNVRAHQIDATRGPGDENSLANAEEQAAGGYVDPTTGVPYPNTANLTGATGDIFAYTDVINWNNNGTFDGGLPLPADIGNWQDIKPAPYNIADVQFLGMPGSASLSHGGAADAMYDSFIEEVTAIVQLTPGCYRMGVNSDDGFKATVAPGIGDPFGLILGSFNTGRGSADSTFDFVVTTAGYYPFRLLWWNGAGGANLEWFTVDLGTGNKILVNQVDPNSVKAFRTGQGTAHVKSIVPADGYQGVETNGIVKITLVDDLTTVVDGSISLSIDGTVVTPVIVNGATTTVTTSPGSYNFVTSHTGTLIWGESTTPQTMHTNNFSFAVRPQSPDDLPSYTAGTFWIEAEDFDATGTPVPDAVNTMPYDIGGGADPAGPYNGVGAILNVDYFNADNLDNGPTIYRSVGDPAISGRSVDVAVSPGNNFGEQRPGGFTMTANYTIGWGASGDWYNYTRKITNGIYTAMSAQSVGDAAAGTPDVMGGTLSMVTAGVGTTTQTLKQLGTFNGPSTGTWGLDALVPLYAPDGSQAAFKITTATTTLRFTNRRGDYDWIVVIPVTGIPPKVTAASPLANTDTPAASAVPRDAKVRLTIEDFSTASVTASVKLFFDANDVTSTASIAKVADITTVTYDPGLLAGAHTYELHFTDNGTPALTQTNKATFTVNAVMGTPGQFVIEAEDFDNGGVSQAAASTMPYLGGAYATLGSVLGVDYNDNDANDSRPYRGTLVPNVNHDQQTDAGTLDVVRADTWTMTANYKIGWAGDGNWYNYTRTFPANTYEVWAGLSHDTTDGLRGSVSLVLAGAGTANQTVFNLGSFNGPTSGAWGTDNLVQMKDSFGNVTAVSLSGVQTVRFNASSGDYDYLVFAPTAATPSKWITSASATATAVTIKWIGGGTLQWAPALTSPVTSIIWTDLGPGTPAGTFTEPIGTATRIYRVRQ